MTALTQDRDTPARDGFAFSDPVAADAVIFAGAIICLDATGYAVPASTATTLTARGRAQHPIDNTGGEDGDRAVVSERGVYRYENDGTDTIDISHVGQTAYLVDDQTVADTDGTGTRSAAGTIRAVDDDGVWIEF